MAEERSVIAYGHYREAAQRFEYFIVGVAGALCAYVSQHLEPKKLGSNPYTIEVVSLLLLIGAVAAGLLRIHSIVNLHKISTNKLAMAEARGQLVANLGGGPLLNKQTGDVYSPSDAAKQIGVLKEVIGIEEAKYKKLDTFAVRCFRIRNWLLAIGFLGLILSRILEPYFKP